MKISRVASFSSRPPFLHHIKACLSLFFGIFLLLCTRQHVKRSFSSLLLTYRSQSNEHLRNILHRYSSKSSLRTRLGLGQHSNVFVCCYWCNPLQHGGSRICQKKMAWGDIFYRHRARAFWIDAKAASTVNKFVVVSILLLNFFLFLYCFYYAPFRQWDQKDVGDYNVSSIAYVIFLLHVVCVAFLIRTMWKREQHAEV